MRHSFINFPLAIRDTGGLYRFAAKLKFFHPGQGDATLKKWSYYSGARPHCPPIPRIRPDSAGQSLRYISSCVMRTIILWLRHLAPGRWALEQITTIPFTFPDNVRARMQNDEFRLVSAAADAVCRERQRE
jgi:hypothetical protein